ncbi:HORMA-1 domain-containing protein [Amycolatopsis japonica]
MSTPLTFTSSFTITNARYIGAKIGADLRQLRSMYGKPVDVYKIDKLAEEAALLLKAGYLGIADYGFRDQGTNNWKLRLRYRATAGRQLLDDPPGRLPRSADVAKLPFHSYMSYSDTFNALSIADQTAFKAGLPVQRTAGTEPGVGLGNSTPGHGYSSNGIGVTRDIFVTLAT